MRRTACALALVLAGCGGGSDSSPAPSSNATAVTASLGTTSLQMTKTTQATGTATLSNGTSQPVTTGWKSDTPTVATVTDTGLVTGVANGLANIYVVSGGRQGQVLLRVVPNYPGSWGGRYVIRSCTQSGVFTTIGFCSTNTVGSSLPVTMSITQTGESIQGTFLLGTLNFTSFTAPIAADGSAAFTSTTTSGGTITIDVAWRINSTSDGRITGTQTQTWRASTSTGQGITTSDVSDALVRTASTGAPPALTPLSPTATFRDLMHAIREQ